MVTEEKVFLPTAEELRAAEIEQALEVGSITFFHFFCIFYDNIRYSIILYVIMIDRWKVRLEPLVFATCSPTTASRSEIGGAAVRSGRRWMARNRNVDRPSSPSSPENLNVDLSSLFLVSR